MCVFVFVCVCVFSYTCAHDVCVCAFTYMHMMCVCVRVQMAQWLRHREVVGSNPDLSNVFPSLASLRLVDLEFSPFDDELETQGPM